MTDVTTKTRRLGIVKIPERLIGHVEENTPVKLIEVHARDSGVGFETSPVSGDTRLTLDHSSTSLSYNDSGHPEYTSPLHRFAAFFGLVEDEEVIYMNKTITFNSVVGKIGFSHSFSGLLPKPRWFPFLRKRGRRMRPHSETSTSLIDHGDVTEGEVAGRQVSARRFSKNPILNLDSDIEEEPMEISRESSGSSLWKKLSFGRRSCQKDHIIQQSSGRRGAPKLSHHSVRFEGEDTDGSITAAAPPQMTTCSIWNGHLLDPDEDIDHGFPTTLSRSHPDLSDCEDNALHESYISGPYPTVHEESTLQIEAETVINEVFAFVDGSSSDSSCDAVIVCDENNNNLRSPDVASHMRARSDGQGNTDQEDVNISPNGRSKPKWRSKSVPELSVESSQSQDETKRPERCLPFHAADDIILNWSGSCGDNDVTDPKFGTSLRHQSCRRDDAVYMSKRASLPITCKTTLKLLQSVCNILDPNMATSQPVTENSCNDESRERDGQSCTPTPFQKELADAIKVHPGTPASGQSDESVVGNSGQLQSCAVKDMVETKSRPVNIVCPLNPRRKSDTYGEARILEDDGASRKEDNTTGQAAKIDAIEDSTKKCDCPPKLSNVSVIHDSTVSSIANETDSGKKLSSARVYDHAADGHGCGHSTPMRINNEGRSSKMALRFSPIPEAEAYDYPIKGSSDESDIKRRNLAFDVFRKTSGGSINYNIDPGRDRNDDRVGTSWSSVPYVTYFLFCLNILVFAIYICNSSVDAAGLQPNLLINNYTTTLAGTNITQLRLRPNPWIGPNLKFLIGIGALYAPCVREDMKVKEIVKETALTPPDVLGCCEIRQRGLAAMATYRDCKRFGFGHGMIWTKEAQCGDIQLHVKNSANLRPCCVSTEGKCMMLARVDCKKLDGIFHNTGPEHCSQINCLGDICQFYENNSTYTPLNPNQWWRIIVSPFYHYGGLHLIMTLVGYISIGKQLERSVGHLRIFIIYLGTAMMGLLAGGVFLPYQVHIGGTASVFGLFGVLQIQLLQTWKTHVKPCSEIAILFFFFIVYTFLGFLPMVDNYEHIGGYLAGLLLGCILLPYVTFGSWKLGVRRVVFAFSLSLTIIFVLFLVFFYFIDPDFTFPEELVYFSCLPFTSDFCENDDVEIK